VTHWITTICFFALLISGGEIVISHPRFYWGETGNVLTTPLFQLPIPSSRNLVRTGYSYVLPDQNGWSRYLHFEAAWALVLTGLVYAIWGLWTGHFRKNLFPARADRTWRVFLGVMADHIRLKRPPEAFSYNVVQRTSYLIVILVLFPFVIWTGLALSPAFDFQAISHGRSVNNKLIWQVTRAGSHGLSQSNWAQCPRFAVNFVAALAADCTRHARAERQIGVGGIDDGVNVRLSSDIALADFYFHWPEINTRLAQITCLPQMNADGRRFVFLDATPTENPDNLRDTTRNSVFDERL
jgi:cytochrome b subunit of formate dehydrogenase